ncbi:MAG: nitrite/sulfite reductase, partial [Candidatus Fervidibacter sp.]
LWRTNKRYRVSRVKSRFKVMVDDYGPERIRQMIEQALGRKFEDYPDTPRSIGFTNHMGIHEQKRNTSADGGRSYYIGAPVLVGQMKGEHLIALADWLETFGGDFRITRQQNFILTGVPESKVDETVALLKELGYSPFTCPLIANGIACTGDPFCNYAVTDSKNHLRELIAHLRLVFGDGTWQQVRLTLHMDGCPHACAQHWVGDIGFQGTAATLPDGTKQEGFDIILDGGIGELPRIGRQIIRRVPAHEVKFVVEELIRAYLNERQNVETFQQWCLRVGDERLKAIAAEITVFA